LVFKAESHLAEVKPFPIPQVGLRATLADSIIAESQVETVAIEMVVVLERPGMPLALK